MNQNIQAGSGQVLMSPYVPGKDNSSPCKYELHEVGPSLHSVEDKEAKTLSVVATAYDVRDAVRILKKQPEGLSMAESMDAFKKRILNLQKIAVYEYWGLVLREGDRVRLSALGWELARRIEPEIAIFRAALNDNPSYRSALEWALNQRLDRIAHPDLIAYWTEQNPPPAAADFISAVKVKTICFFHLCQAAELGTVTLGKRGQPARLLIDKRELAKHLQTDYGLTMAEGVGSALASAALRESGAVGRSAAAHGAEKARVFISSADKSPIAEQAKAALTIAEYECEVVEREAIGVAGVTDGLRKAARKSVAGVIILTADDFARDELGGWRLKECVAMAVGAACAFCDNRVVLLKEQCLVIPDALLDLKQCEFQGEGMSWESGMRLTRTIKEWNAGDQSVIG
jgi:hypothetical protein